MMIDKAPIVLFAYNRPSHLQRTLDALSKNSLANESKLYIFSDGPREIKDQNNVMEVRKLLNKISGFKEVIITLNDVNKGLKKSVLDGITEILNVYDCAIVLEDDLVTSPFFLQYMNSILKSSFSGLSILSVTGYNYPIDINKECQYKFYPLFRASSYGWGTWSNVWKKFLDFKINKKEFLNNKKIQKGFNSCGNDLTPMLKAQIYKNINSWAVLWSYFHYSNNGFCLYPTKSLIKDIGDDSTGTHKIRKKSKIHNFDPKFSLETPVEISVIENLQITKRVKDYFDITFLRKLINYSQFELYMSLVQRRST
jgi:hypothetical protein